jgi:large subunit ribosomal protein L18
MASIQEGFARRKARLRYKLDKRRNSRPRLSVHRSNNHIYAQIIDDMKSVTIASASTLDKECKGDLNSGSNSLAATHVGKIIAERALKAGIKEVVFDRSGFLYHGRIKALADAARENGLEF